MPRRVHWIATLGHECATAMHAQDHAPFNKEPVGALNRTKAVIGRLGEISFRWQSLAWFPNLILDCALERVSKLRVLRHPGGS